MKKTYTILPQPPTSYEKKFPDIYPVLLKLLWQRDIRTQKDIENFLNPVYGKKQYDPFKFKEMKKVVKRILDAASQKERVLIYGDYDADGVTSAILMIEALEKLYQNSTEDCCAEVYLPHREEEGYGLTMKAVEYIKQKNIDLVITCDCGSGNTAELEALKNLGIDTIVLDHHIAPKTRPPAYGFVNPKFKPEKYPFRELAACGVVFKVIQALRITLEKKKTKAESPLNEGFEKWCLDLVALATVADMMPLKQENRILVKWGLVVFNKTKRLGLQALMRSAGLTGVITAYEIGFVIAPRINAAGRLDHANVAFDLLRQKNKARLEHDAKKLSETNEARQKLTEKIYKQAATQVQTQFDNGDKILVAYNLKKNAWATGVLGLVAGKLVREFTRPAMVIGNTKHGVAGSGRAMAGFDITAGLRDSKDLLKKFGGHPQACGFTLKEAKQKKALVEKFKSRMERFSKTHLTQKMLTPLIKIDAELMLDELNGELIRALGQLEPYGQKNPEPVFLTKNVVVSSHRLVGKNQDHCKLEFTDGKRTHDAIAFRVKDHVKHLTPGDKADIAYSVAINEWRGRKSIQLMIKEVFVK